MTSPKFDTPRADLPDAPKQEAQRTLPDYVRSAELSGSSDFLTALSSLGFKNVQLSESAMAQMRLAV